MTKPLTMTEKLRALADGKTLATYENQSRPYLRLDRGIGFEFFSRGRWERCLGLDGDLSLVSVIYEPSPDPMAEIDAVAYPFGNQMQKLSRLIIAEAVRQSKESK